jgi:phage shock protein C
MLRNRLSRIRFYLDKKNAKALGVCSGIADYTGWDPLIVRVGTVLLTCFTPLSAITVPAYIIIGLVANDKPKDLYEMRDDERRFWQSARMAPSRTIRDTRGEFRDIDRRLSDIETYVTSSSRTLSSEIEKLR